MIDTIGAVLDLMLDDLHGFLVRWGIFILLGLLVWLTWKFIRLMPSTRPQRLDPGSRSSVRFEDVAGVEEARGELEEVVQFLRDPDRFRALGARVPRGILLHGPPGTGKTMLAKAVANESGARFYAQSAASFVEMFSGLGAARIRTLFETARKHRPAIVFIDELDAVGTRRAGSGLNREQDQTLNQLLVELDGFDEHDGVVVIGASNRLEDLDPALLRPGRFDRRVLIPPPDLTGRADILAVHVRGKPLAADVDLDEIARHTAGLTGAELANICNEAAIAAARDGRDRIGPAHFDLALERVLAGLARRHLITEREKRVVAYHEAGHALAAWLTGEPPHRVAIVARGTALGYTLRLPSEDRSLHTREELVDLLVVALAGRAAEESVFGRITTGAADDLERAADLAGAMVSRWGMGETTRTLTLRAGDPALSEETRRLRDAEVRALTDAAYADALVLVTAHREALDRLVAALLEHETLDRGRLAELLAGVGAPGALPTP